MVEGGELAVPHLAKGFHPIGYLGKGGKAGFAIALPSLPADSHQPAFREHFDMLGDGGAAYGEIFRDCVQVHCLTGYKADDVPSDGVGDGLENVSSGLHGDICKDMLTNIRVSIWLRKFILKFQASKRK